MNKTLNLIDTTTQVDDEDIGGLWYVAKYGDLYIPYTILYAFGFIIGCTGNLLIMTAIGITKELRNPTNMLIFNLSLADLVVSGLVDSVTIVGVLVGRRWFLSEHMFCEFIAAACLVACATSIISIVFLAFNRYINICHHGLYRKIFSTRMTLLYCFLTWSAGMLVDLPNILGWGRHTYSSTTLSCLWDRTASHSYTLYMPITTIIIPCLFTLFFYIRIYFYAKNLKNQIQPSGTLGIKRMKNQLRVSQGLFASFILLAISWLPYAIVVMSDWNLTHPIAAEMYTLLLSHLNSAANPILYAIFNPLYRQGYRNVLRNLNIKKKLMRLENKTNNNNQQTRNLETVFNINTF